MGKYIRNKIWWIDYYHQGKRYREPIGTSKALAEKVLKKRQLEIAEGKFLDIQKGVMVKFNEMANLYVDSYSKVNKRSWKRDELSIKYLNRFLGQKYLHEINPLDIEKYKQERRKKGLEPATVNLELACLKHIFTKAIEWEKTKENPAARIKLFKLNNMRTRYLEKEEIARLIQACPGHLKPIVVLALFTGMRKGEILNLKWDDIDLDKRSITLLQTKNNEIRIVFMSEVVYATLLGAKREPNVPWVFFNKQGKPYRVDMRKSFTSALKRAEITNFRFHDLRHTFASQLVMAGIDLYSVQKLLGHKSIQMTQRYAHLSPDYQKAALEKLSNQMVTNWSQTAVLGELDKKRK